MRNIMENQFVYKGDMDNLFGDVKIIYDHIVDDLSKEIYLKRLLLSYTEDIRFIRELILLLDVGQKLQKELNKFMKENRKVYIYGAGIRGGRLYRCFPEIKWSGFVDSVKKGTYGGAKIIPLDEFRPLPEDVIIISNKFGDEDIKEQIMERGGIESHIVSLNDFEKLLTADQYFEQRCIKYFKKTDGCFIDAGCYDGGDTLKFLQSGLEAREIYSFEPDLENWKNCSQILKKYKHVKLCNMGLLDKPQKSNFKGGLGGSSYISEDGCGNIEINTIDNIIKTKVGFIKMDIEGSELRALKGGKHKIMADSPNMAICVYHKKEDIIEIPKLLLKMNPNYHFALGHYTLGKTETVLYAFEM